MDERLNHGKQGQLLKASSDNLIPLGLYTDRGTVRADVWSIEDLLVIKIIKIKKIRTLSTLVAKGIIGDTFCMLKVV